MEPSHDVHRAEWRRFLAREWLMMCGGIVAGILVLLVPIARSAVSPIPRHLRSARALKQASQPTVRLPPLEQSTGHRAALQQIYGWDGEYWSESVDEAKATPLGQARLSQLADMAKRDPRYNDPADPESPYQKWARTFRDDDEAFWRAVVSEYKESRRADYLATFTAARALSDGVLETFDDLKAGGSAWVALLLPYVLVQLVRSIRWAWVARR